jgi:hypothetical protein
MDSMVETIPVGRTHRCVASPPPGPWDRRSLQAAPASQIWSLIAVVLLGLVMLAIARFVLRSPFFRVPRESDTPAR